MLRVVLVHPGSVILPELAESLGHYAQKSAGAKGSRNTSERPRHKHDGERSLS